MVSEIKSEMNTRLLLNMNFGRRKVLFRSFKCVLVALSFCMLYWLFLPNDNNLEMSNLYKTLNDNLTQLVNQQKNGVDETSMSFNESFGVMRQIAVNCPNSTHEVLRECYEKEVADVKGTLCETIHIVLLCIGKCIQLINILLKSLLKHRHNPLHFHMIVNKNSEIVTRVMFDTWHLPDVKYTCYNAENWLPLVYWLPNRHYSGIFALVKLILPDILPAALDNVIVLDSDLTVMCDVAELWALFRNMTEEQVIGLVENESNWYRNSRSKPWSAIGKGFNTGVMLLDLKKMRTIDWSALWRKTAMENAVNNSHTLLADQDVINTVINCYPGLVYNISCQYNVQLSIRTLAKTCFGEDSRNLKIIHWNSGYKYNIVMESSDYFMSVHQSYVNFDGNLLREKLHRCDKSEVRKVKYPNCKELRAGQDIKLRTHVLYFDYTYSPLDNFDVTLVLHLSMDRIYFLEKLVEYWTGPLSVAIYLTDREVTTFRNLIRNWSKALMNRQNVGYHLVYKHYAVQYPVNYLRNVAMEHSRTEYLLFMDVEFMPSEGIYDHLRTAIRSINPFPQKKVIPLVDLRIPTEKVDQLIDLYAHLFNLCEHQKCLIVPGFEIQSFRSSIPRNKTELLSRLVGLNASGDVTPFMENDNRPTDYQRWITAEEPYEVKWKFDYEPYLVVHRTVPKYDPRLSGFRWSKIARSVELNAQGYRPMVLPNVFAVYTPHAQFKDINTDFRAYVHFMQCLEVMEKEFMDLIQQKYDVTFDTFNSTVFNSEVELDSSS